MRYKKSIAAFTLLLGIIVSDVSSQQESQTPIGLVLYSKGLTTCIAKSDFHFDPSVPQDQKYSRGPFNPNSAIVDDRNSNPNARCFWNIPVKGPIVGPEGTGAGILQAVIDNRCGELAQMLPVGYKVSNFDFFDTQYVATCKGLPKSCSSVWDKWVAPCVAKPNPTPPPNPTPTPTPNPTPIPTPSPTPEPCEEIPSCPCPNNVDIPKPVGIIESLTRASSFLDTTPSSGQITVPKLGEKVRADQKREQRTIERLINEAIGLFTTFNPKTCSTGCVISCVGKEK